MNTSTLPLILVADADPASLSETLRLLSREEFQVFSAICRSSAISSARMLPLDLILCDLSLATLDPHFDLIAEIHQFPERADVPVIFTSTGQGAGVIRRQHSFGGAYHIKKPFDPAVLVALIERALWMPHLIRTHIRPPHFSAMPGVGTLPPVSARPPIHLSSDPADLPAADPTC